jgi:hypothetical protein
MDGYQLATMKAKNLVPSEDPRKFYYKLDGIHLVFEDDKLIGWYCPDGPMEEGINS